MCLKNTYGIAVFTPTATERDFINQVIFDELVRNDIRPESRKEYVRIINRFADEEGAEGVILGCTEIPLLVHQSDVKIPVFDTTRIHAEAAVDYALGRS
ncbi:MAG: aspartate/glutamate racemase family protein [Methanoregula sp.]|nr:aspartate/glutamate racemase family protein [Methanoregula sp.]